MMKKFARGVLDGLRQSVSTPPKDQIGEIEETLKSEHFAIAKTVRHGFPYQPTAMAYDAVQHILAIGTKNGSLRIFGRPGVDCHVRHDADVAVLQILFLANEGALVTVVSDDTLHLWNLRQKRPEIVHSLKFQRERITYCHLPFQSKWLYIGTERGNVHIVNIESFILSGYVINWNKAIELSRKTHPGPVVFLGDNPIDSSKLLIGFESGAIVLWDLKSKTAETRFSCQEALKAVAWHHEGKQFMCSHTDGSLSTWNIKTPQKSVSTIYPHAKVGKEGKPDPCKPITKVEWKSQRNSDPFVIFCGGMPYDKAGRTPSLTVMHGKNTTVLEMEHNVVDFITLCETPWHNDFQEPYAIVVLLQNDLVVVDLTSPGYPCFENPYPMDIHESPVTAVAYYADCPPDLIPAFYSVGAKQKRSGFSEKDWPVKGGEWGQATCSYPEIIITGHADGSLKFWDASAVTLQVLYKLKTAKLFEKPKGKGPDLDDDPFAIQLIYLCPESRIMCVSGATHVILFRFSKQEGVVEIPCLDISLIYEVYDDIDSPEYEFPPKPAIGTVSQQSGSGSYSSNASDSKPIAFATSTQDCGNVTNVKMKPGPRKWPAGYQPDLVCCLTWVDGEPPANVTSISINSSYGLLAFGNECGLAIVDILQKTTLLNMGTPDLYGSLDPYQRAPRSPKSKRPQGLEGLSQQFFSEESKSPTNEQGSSPLYKSPARNRHTSQQNPAVLDAIDESSPQQQDSSAPPKAKSEQMENGQDSSSDISKNDAILNDIIQSQNDANEYPLPVFSSNEDLLTIPDNNNITDNKNTVVKSSPNSSPRPGLRKTFSDTTGEILGEKDEDDIKGSLRPKSKSLTNLSLAERGRGDSPEKGNAVAIVLSGADGMKVTAAAAGQEDKVDEDENLTPEPTEDTSMMRRLRKMSTKVRKTMKGTSKQKLPSTTSIEEQIETKEGTATATEKLERSRRKSVANKEPKFDLIDLRQDDVSMVPPIRRMSHSIHRDLDKNDGSFSRSRSSSMSSLDNISKEAIQCLVFADSYTRKTDAFVCPCLWVGTSLGSVLVIVLNLPPSGEQRMNQPVIVSPSGTIFRLKGAILAMSFLDCNGLLIPCVYENWRDSGRDIEKRDKSSSSKSLNSINRQQSVSSNKARMSPTSSTEVNDRQFAIICSEKQARVMSLPSQTCAYKVKITETSFVTKAQVITMRGKTFKESVCLACYVANGHIMVFSLPSLKPLLDVDYLPLTDIRIARTFCFSNCGHACYLTSPTEVQKVSMASEVCYGLQEMLGDLFLPCETPEAPKQGFFKNLFGGGAGGLDREELFGETSGKASKGLAKHIPGSAGIQQTQAKAGSLAGELQKTRRVLDERGEKLTEVEERTAAMMAQAESFSVAAHSLMLKYKDKKWYQL